MSGRARLGNQKEVTCAAGFIPPGAHRCTTHHPEEATVPAFRRGRPVSRGFSSRITLEKKLEGVAGKTVAAVRFAEQPSKREKAPRLQRRRLRPGKQQF